MKSMAKLLTIAVLLFAFTTCTSADTVWTLNNLQFNRPGFGINSATGSLTVSTALTIISWDIQVSGTNAQADYHYTSSPPVGGASLSADQLFVQFFDFSVNPNVFLDLLLASPITNAGGTIDLLPGDPSNPPFRGTIACPGCGTLTSEASISSTVSAPEPSSVGLLGSSLLGLLGIGVGFRQKRPA
jgi:hypothetical protein